MSNIHDSTKTLSSRLAYKARKLKRKCNNEEDYAISNKYSNNKGEYIPSNSFYKLNEKFYAKPCILLAQNLLGKILVRRLPSGEILKGRIVETECYLGSEDKASHSYQGKKTERNQAMFEKPGTVYVYKIYGMYHCFNISSLEEGSAVLIRSLEPLQGETTMHQLRGEKRKSDKILKHKDLCNGPSKLCQAFKISKEELNKADLCLSNDVWIEEGLDINMCNIVSCKRIGINSCGEEWANKPLRFYVKNCEYVSVRNKQAEMNITMFTHYIT